MWHKKRLPLSTWNSNVRFSTADFVPGLPKCFSSARGLPDAECTVHNSHNFAEEGPLIVTTCPGLQCKLGEKNEYILLPSSMNVLSTICRPLTARISFTCCTSAEFTDESPCLSVKEAPLMIWSGPLLFRARAICFVAS